MITGKLSLLLHLLAIFGVFMLMTVLILTLLQQPLLRRLRSYTPSARRQWLWLIGLLPMLSGLLAVFFVMLPSLRFALFSDCPECHVHDDPYEHLCWYHPLDFYLLSWQSFFLLGIALLVLHGLWRSLSSIMVLEREAAKLMAFADNTTTGYQRLDSDIPCAVTLGLWRPRSLISSCLETALSPEELEVVARHEAAHAANRDPLKQFIYRVVAFLFPSRAFIREMELAMEQCADLAVARHVPDRALIASTILKVRKMSEHSASLIAGAGVNNFNASVLEQRIRFLLTMQHGWAFPVAKLLLGFSLLMVAGLLSGDAVHHGIEFLLSY